MDNGSNQHLETVANGQQPKASMSVSERPPNSFSVLAWMANLRAKLLILRGLDLTNEEFAAFAGQLTRDGYTEDKATKAELWMLRGDWSYRGQNARVEYADFYPRREQLPVDDNLVVMSVPEREALCRRYYDAGYNDRRAEDIHGSVPDDTTRETARAFRTYLVTIDDLAAQVALKNRELQTYRESDTLAWRAKYEVAQQARADDQRRLQQVAELSRQYANYRDNARRIIFRLMEDGDFYDAQHKTHHAHKDKRNGAHR